MPLRLDPEVYCPARGLVLQIARDEAGRALGCVEVSYGGWVWAVIPQRTRRVEVGTVAQALELIEREAA